MSAVSVRPAAVAGAFYPGDVRVLRSSIDAMLADATAATVQPKALIVPHAGYVYSGPIAASAYAALRKSAVAIRRVVIFGPAHRVWIPGLAASSADVFDTPLGQVPVDREAMAAVADLPQVEVNDAAHAAEHSLEVQLPFLQAVLDDFTIAPFVVGGATPDQVAEVMERLWGGPETLIVVSSDLSHYLSYAEARQIDRATADSILARHSLGHHEQACGATPINGLMAVARRKRLAPTLLDLRNSGDTAGDKSRVVGYAAFAFTEPGHD
jgi:AmmeMemoRadiSam system protein B